MVVGASAAAALLGASLAAPIGVSGMGSLPACRYDDILTAPRGYGDWSVTLVDTILEVPDSYVPPDLVSVSKAGIGGSGTIRAIAVRDLRALAAAARAAGNPIAVESAYRSYAAQESIFVSWIAHAGYTQALAHTARPGHSEHQLGLAIDFRSAGGSVPSTRDWGTTPAGAWMRKHAWRYGWVQSYPKDQQSTTCYMYEAWHFRYVGRPLAARIHDSGLTVRQYLWSHFTTATVATVGATPEPTISPGPSPVASSLASPGDSPLASTGTAPTGTPTEAASSVASAAGGGAEPGATIIDPVAATTAIGLFVALAAIGSALGLGLRRRRRRVGRGP
jgi:D-alanyl-D-alanine carboxypeptidase